MFACLSSNPRSRDNSILLIIDLTGIVSWRYDYFLLVWFQKLIKYVVRVFVLHSQWWCDTFTPFVALMWFYSHVFSKTCGHNVSFCQSLCYAKINISRTHSVSALDAQRWNWHPFSHLTLETPQRRSKGLMSLFHLREFANQIQTPTVIPSAQEPSLSEGVLRVGSVVVDSTQTVEHISFMWTHPYITHGCANNRMC